MSNDDASKKLNIAAVIIMLLIIGGIVAMYKVREVVALDSGPSMIAGGASGNIYVAADRRIFVLDSGGALLRELDLIALGLGETVSGLQELSDGSLLIGSYDRSNIFHCDANGSQCTPRLNRDGRVDGVFHSVFHFVADESAGMIYATDGGVHRLVQFNHNGDLVRETTGGTPGFCYPNAISLMPDGSLAIADTNNHRIAIVASGKELGKLLAEIRTADGETFIYRCADKSSQLMSGKGDRFLAREIDFSAFDYSAAPTYGRLGRTWPIAMTRDSGGNWWVINGGNNLRNGDVMVFDADGIPVNRVTFANDQQSDPLALLARGAEVLVGDPYLITLTLTDRYGASQRDFGDAALQRRFAEMREDKQLHRVLYTVNQGVLFLALFGAVVVAFLDLRRRRRQA